MGPLDWHWHHTPRRHLPRWTWAIAISLLLWLGIFSAVYCVMK